MRGASWVLAILGLSVQAASAGTVTFYGQEVPTATNSIIYVIDLSGSMNGGRAEFIGLDGQTTTGAKLDRAKTELIRSIQGLTTDMEFNLIAYDCDLLRWFPAKQRAEPGPKASAISWVGSLRPGGATGTGPAVAAALADKSNFTVVLLSDGAPNCIGSGWVDDFGAPGGIVDGHLSMILSNNTQGAKIHCFGIDAYGEFEQFMRDVASNTGGRYYPVP